MFSIQPSPLPDNALLAAYSRDGGYTDCKHSGSESQLDQADIMRQALTT